MWVERYMEAGEFELEGPIDELWAGLVREGDLVFFSHSGYSYRFPGFRACMIIESKYTKSDAEKGKRVFCNGRSLESLLEHRINFGCRYGTMRSLKDGPLVSVRELYQGALGAYSIGLRDYSYRGATQGDDPDAAGGSYGRPVWADHHCPLRTYELVPEEMAGSRPYYFNEYLALAAVSCNCGPLARTNRQFEYMRVCTAPVNASYYPEPTPGFEFAKLEAPGLIKGPNAMSYNMGAYQADGWYFQANRSLSDMADDTDTKYPESWAQAGGTDKQYEETRFDWQDYTTFSQPILQNEIVTRYSEAYWKSLHMARDPYSGVGQTVYTVVTDMLKECDGLDGGWGMKLSADSVTGTSSPWFTDRGYASRYDQNDALGELPHANGHVELAFELYKGRDLTINGPHNNDGQAVIFSEDNDNVRYIDYLHSQSDYKNVVYRLTGLEYTVERIWNIDWNIRYKQSLVRQIDNEQTALPDGQQLSEARQKDRERYNSELESLKADRENIVKSLEAMGMQQQYFSAEVRSLPNYDYMDQHYPVGLNRIEMVSSEETKSDTFISDAQKRLDTDVVKAIPDPAKESRELAESPVYPGRAAETMDAWYKKQFKYKDSQGKDATKDYWEKYVFYPQWHTYVSQLKESNVNTLKLRANSKSRDIETEVDFNAFQIAGKEYYVGDRVTLVANVDDLVNAQFSRDPKSDTGELIANPIKTMRCDEIAYSIDSSGFTVVPTFKILEDPDEETEMEGPTA